jgi:hypothetical protein
MVVLVNILVLRVGDENLIELLIKDRAFARARQRQGETKVPVGTERIRSKHGVELKYTSRLFDQAG